jgi:hypothetical protein
MNFRSSYTFNPQNFIITRCSSLVHVDSGAVLVNYGEVKYVTAATLRFLAYGCARSAVGANSGKK